MPESPVHPLGKVLHKYRQLGLLPTLKMIWVRVLGRIPWWIFRFRNPGAAAIRGPVGGAGQGDSVPTKEDRICSLLERIHGRSFLEIGIGGTPSLKRVRTIISNSIEYTGCDFEQVCEYHKAVLGHEGLLKSHIQFVGNRIGTYCRTLFDMVRQKRRFAMIYLDGAHTFYTDLPAFYLAHILLEPGGYFLVDDIDWTLSLLKCNMGRNFEEWLYYHRIYKFAEYTPEQHDEKAIKMLAEEVLMRQYGYELLREDSLDGWWVLKKPHG